MLDIARQQPDAVAIEDGPVQLRYAELAARMQEVAEQIAAVSGPGEIVAVDAVRGVDTIVAMLGVFAAGRIYLPVDPVLPAARRQQLVDLARPGLSWPSGTRFARPRVLTTDDAAYVLFTSGSTGIPKGVVGTSAGLSNLTRRLSALYGYRPADRLLQFAAFSWDTSLEEILPALAGGATVVLRPAELGTLRDFVSFVAEHELTGLNLPTSYWAELVASAERLPPSVRLVVIGGEAVPADAVQRWRDQYGDRIRLTNTYGLTEATAVTTYADLHTLVPAPGELFAPIGGPIDGVTVRLIDDAGAEAPDGEVGELVIGGPGVAAAYLDGSDVDGRFQSDPATGRHWLKTGDLAVRLADGLLYFRGRRDHQLKVRGYRIEPAEVERALRGAAGVAEAAVVAARVGSRQQLAAFVTTADGGRLVPAELHRVARETLPGHMRPARITITPALPRLPNGKVDRRALVELAQAPADPVADVGHDEGGRDDPLVSVVSEVLAVHAQPEDSFLGLGGDSISAIVVASRLQSIGRRVGVEQLMASERLCEVALAPVAPPVDQPAVDQRPVGAGITASGRLPLTPMQQGVLFEAALSTGTQVYLDQDVWQITGRVDVDWFWRAWQAVVARHESLRSAFFWPEGEEPYRVVQDAPTLATATHDWRDKAPAEQARLLADLLAAGMDEHIDLSRPPLMRLILVVRGDTDASFIWYAHRLVLDGWSTTVLLDEFIELYSAGVRGERPDLGPPMDYQRYLAEATRPPGAGATDFWRTYLAGASPTPLPGHDRGQRRHERGSTRHENIAITLTADLAAALEQLCRTTRVTLSTVFRAAWGVILSRYAGRSDVVFGATNAGRPAHLDAANGVGLFINSLPVRVKTHPERSVRALLREVQEAAIAAAPFELTPLSFLHGLLGSPEEALFESLVIVQNYPGAASYSRAGALSMVHQAGFEQIHYPLSLVVRHIADEELRAEIWFDPELVHPYLGQAMVSQLETILRAFATGPSATVGSIAALGTDERGTLAAWAAGPPLGQPARPTLDLVYETAARDPHRTALVDGAQVVSYGDLVAMVDRVAGNLHAAGVGRGDLVAVLGQRSIATIATLLAVWRLGGGYLGLDPELPPGRVATILADSRPAATVVETPAVAPATGDSLIDMASLNAEGTDTDWPVLQFPDDAADTVAYVVYTSGSTGRPKGVVVRHIGLTNYVAAAIEKYRLGPGDRGLVGASIGVDWFASELYPMLAAGATAVLRDADLYRDVDALLEFCRRTEISVLILPTALWHQLVRELGPEPQLPSSLRVIDIGGERAVPALVRRWRSLVGDRIKLFNGYGPTETTIEATSAVLAGSPDGVDLSGSAEVPIGRPLANVRCYVLDGSDQMVPVGGVGELHIGGFGVATGYLNDPRLTGDKFVPDPYSAAPGARMYSSGDLVRWLPTGQLEYLGRNDRQLKLAGNRFNAGEVESALLDIPEVGEAWLASRHDDDRTVIGIDAYVVPVAGRNPDPSAIRERLRLQLPSAMVPSTITVVDYLPRNLAGKVDVAALPQAVKSDAGRPESGPPESPDPIATAIFEVVGGGNLDMGFFAAGGNSIMGMQLIGRFRRDFSVQLSFRDLVTAPTLRDLAASISARLAGQG